MRDDLFSREELNQAELDARRAQDEAELAAERARQERIQAAVDAGTAADRRSLANGRQALRAATLAALKAEIEHARVCHRGNKH